MISLLTKNDAILLALGCIIGILAALVIIPLIQPARGTPVVQTPAPVPPQILPAASGTAADAGELTTKEDVISFIRAHTAPVQPASTPARDFTAVPLSSGTRRFRYDIDTSSFKPDEYIVTAAAVVQDASASTLFNLLASRSSSPLIYTLPTPLRPDSEGYYIAIDPIGDHVVGDKFTITGTTNLPADAELLVQTYSSSFKPTDKSQSGEFSGATGTIRVTDSGSTVPGVVTNSAPAPARTPAPTPVPMTAIPGVTRAYSTTNVQVKEVDEADIIKTDGENIYVVTGSCMHILKAYPAADAQFISSLRFAGHPIALYAGNGRAVLVATDTWTRPISPCTPGKCIYYSSPAHRTLVYVFSVKNPANPQLVREVGIDGSYTSSRMIGSQLYFVTGSPVPYNLDTLELPAIHDDHGGITTPAVTGFNTTDQSFSFSTIGSLDTAGTVPVQAQSFLIGTAGTLYVSPSRLYIATPDPAPARGIRTTSVYAFDLDSGKIAYAAGGSVDGTLLSQYSLDEYDGNLRLATTVSTGSWMLNDGSYSKVTVLDENMAVAGTLPDIAPGERIFAARFMGDRLYLVTFRQTDPFFVIGLADPSRPVILGKLKIPGVSDYLHPYDASHIIGIGRESVSGPLKIALFDVTDVNNPVQQATQSLGGSYSTSPVLTDPKAFLFDKEKDLLVLPVELHGEYQCARGGSCTPPTIWGGAYVYGVSPEAGFSLKGTVQHYSSSYYASQSQVKRALYIEDTLYTMSDAKIVMSDLEDRLLQINELKFQ